MVPIERQWDYPDLSRSLRLAGGITLLISELIGIVGNTFVLIIIARVLQHRKSIPNILILLLTILDLASLPLTYTQALLSYANAEYIGGQTACDYHSTIITFCKYASILVISLISLDRFIAMSYPFCYKDHLLYDETRKYRLAALLLPLFAVTGIVSMLPLLGMSRNVLQYPGSYCLFDIRHNTTLSAVLLGMHICFLGIIIMLVVATNIGVCLQAQRLIQKIKPSLRVSKREEKTLQDTSSDYKQRKSYKRLSPKQEKKLLRTSIVATGLFLACWLPFLVRMLLAISGVPFSEGLDFFSARLASLQSVINPWLYPLTRRQYRYGFWFLSRKAIHLATFGLLKEPNTTLDDIIDARSNRKEAMRFYEEERKKKISKAEETQTTENIELTDTTLQPKVAALDQKPNKARSVSFNISEENANINQDSESAVSD
eukprot:gene13572-4461_t